MAFCTNCGAKLDDGVRFCTECGAPVEDDGGALGSDAMDGFDRIGETTIYDMPSSGTGQSPIQTPPPAPPQDDYYSSSQPPRRRMSGGAIVGITLGIVAAVLVVGFGVFYFTNPLGLSGGIFPEAEQGTEVQPDAGTGAATGEADGTDGGDAEAAEESSSTKDEDDDSGKSNTTVVVVTGGGGTGDGGGTTTTSGGSTVTVDPGNGSSSGGSEIVAPAGYPPVTLASNGEVLPGSDTQRISRSDVANMNDWELAVARNEVLARHGRTFKRADLQEFFNNLSWYHGVGTPDSFDESVISKLEWDNMNTILDLERERGSSYLES